MNTARWIATSALTLLGPSVFAQQPASPAVSRITLPSLPWALAFDYPGFTVQTNEIQKGGRRYFLANNSDNHFTVSVFLEAAHGPVPPGECKRSLEQKVPNNSSLSSTPLKDIAYRQNGDMQILEFTMSDVNGVPIKQRNIFACIAKDGAYVDIHVSKALFKSEDQPTVDKILQSFHFIPGVADAVAPDSAGGSMPLFLEGTRYFRDEQFRESIPPYQKALELEKVSPTLEKKYWFVLLDNLSMAYGITGNLPAAKAIAQYGISKDPGYPLFYYNLACAAAEEGNVPDTELYLKQAYDRRANAIPGETLPDARSDDSFQKLLKQSDFRDFVESLYGSQKP